jgi:hypothetical protein
VSSRKRLKRIFRLVSIFVSILYEHDFLQAQQRSFHRKKDKIADTYRRGARYARDNINLRVSRVVLVFRPATAQHPTTYQDAGREREREIERSPAGSGK